MWSNYAKDRFLAPKLSQLTACKAPVLGVAPTASAAWLPGFVFTSALRVTIGEPQRQLIFNFLRRVDTAILEYTRGQDALMAYFNAAEHSGITQYSRCLYAFEAAIAMTYQAYLLVRQLLPNKPALFTKKDGSELQRLDRVYNASRHADEYIANGGRYAPDSTLTVWLVNGGLECEAATITFAELAEAIESLARVANELMKIEPGPFVPATEPPAN